MNTLKNIVGFIAGIIAYVAGTYILSFLMGIIYIIPIINNLIMFPTPDLYASGIINGGSAYLAVFVSNKICYQEGKTSFGTIFTSVGLIFVVILSIYIDFVNSQIYYAKFMGYILIAYVAIAGIKSALKKEDFE